MENFLDKILAEKRREVDMMVMETPRPVRQTKGFV